MATPSLSSRLKKLASRWISLLASFVLILAWSVPLGSAQAASPAISTGQTGGIPGVSWTGAAGVSETTAQIMARQAQTVESSQPPAPLLPILRSSPTGKTVAGALDQGPLSDPAAPNGPEVAFTLGTSFDGPGSTVNLCGTPPDTMGAVGPTQFIIFVNCNIVSYNKTTGVADGVLSTTPAVFFNSVRSSSVSDPHIRYDRLSQRWFVVMIDVTFPNNRVLIAMSNTSTITAGTVWTNFFFQSANGTHTNCLADYPTPGIDPNAIYIGVNQFCGSSLGTAGYAGSDGYVVQKSSLLSGGPIHVTAFNLASTSSGPYTPQGVDNADPSASEGYFIGTSNAFWNNLDLIRVSSPGSASPTVSGIVPITTANQGNQITQPHNGNTGGTNGNLDASDNRLFSATLRDGQLWTAMGVGVTVSGGVCNGTASFSGATRDAIFWWQFHNIATGQTPSIVQSGQICDTSASNPSFFSYGTIAANGQGHAALGYTIAGLNNFTEPGVSVRLAGDPAGTLPTSYISPVGSFSYNPSFDSGAGNGFRRWGDYSYTSLDPCDDMTLWTIQEYANPNNQYRERVTKLVAPPPAAPASSSPGSVNTGQASVSVAITGTSSSGSGFYDTPASLSTESCRKRLSATVSNGVTVNSVTFTDPTHVSLSLNTTSATPGLATVTITNPDGQSLGSAILQINSTLTSTTTALVPSPNPSVFGQTVALTATVSASAGTPTGSVSFFDGATSLGSATLSGGVATLNIASLTVGTHSNLTAQYAGDSSFSGSTSPAASQTVNKAGTSAALVPSPNPSLFGQSVTLTATLSVTAPGAGTPSGSVNFYDGATLLGSGTLSGGVATLNIASLTVGTHSNLTAVYAGDSSFSGSTSPAASQTVNQAGTTTALVPSPNPSVFGQSVTLTATLSVTSPGAGAPSGSVSFYDGATLLGSATLSGGVATLNIASLTVGTHSNLTAVYAGDSSFSGSTSPAASQTVNKAGTSAALVPSPNPSLFGQSVTLTATLSVTAPGAGTPTGSVSFYDGATLLGSATLSGGVATLNIASLTVGTHSNLTAQYAGDSSFSGSTSPAASQTVNKAGTSAALVPSPNPSLFGQSVTLTATLSVTAPGAGTPSGSVNFYDGATLLGSGTLSGGVATLNIASLTVGTHSNLTAVYAGDSSFSGSTSPAASQTVNQAGTTTALVPSPNPSVFGQSVTLTATLSVTSPGAGAPSGSVSFYDGATLLGSATLSGGVATLNIASLTVGTHSNLTAVYAGDSSFSGSTSPAASQTVNKAGTSAALVPSPNPSLFGQSVTLTATLSVTAPGAGTPTGSVSFYDGATLLGSGTLSGGVATLNTSALGIGSHNLTAQYTGDGSFNGSAAPIYVLTVNGWKVFLPLLMNN